MRVPWQVQIHYFSGTGNTARAARILKQELENQGSAATLICVEQRHLPLPPTDSVNLHILAFPVYAGAVPQIMRQYLQRFSAHGSARFAVLAVVGDAWVGKEPNRKHIPGHEGQSLQEAQRLLARKGYRVHLTDVVPYPANITQFASAMAPDDQERLFQQSDAQVRAIATRLISSDIRCRPCSFAVRCWAVPLGVLYRWFGRRGLGKLYVADQTCTHCGLCAQSCPAKAIRMREGFPRWTLECQGCQRCINICPSRSIQTSVVRLVALFAPIPLSFWLTRGWGKWRSSILWGSLFSLLLPLLADLAIDRAERNPRARAFLGKSFTREYRRYREPQFQPPGDPQKQ
jgi:ferredoxin